MINYEHIIFVSDRSHQDSSVKNGKELYILIIKADSNSLIKNSESSRKISLTIFKTQKLKTSTNKWIILPLHHIPIYLYIYIPIYNMFRLLVLWRFKWKFLFQHFISFFYIWSALWKWPQSIVTESKEIRGSTITQMVRTVFQYKKSLFLFQLLLMAIIFFFF